MVAAKIRRTPSLSAFNRIFGAFMRDDLLDANASAHWARTQVPILQERLTKWHHARPYKLAVEPDSKTGEKFIVAYQALPLDPIMVADVGAIINATRSALDLLAAALAKRNRVKPSPKTHFPIYKLRRDFLFAIKRIEKEQWLTKRQITEIKRLKPYKRGDGLLYPLHQLDIMRKHERLIDARPVISSFRYFGVPGGRPDWQRLDDKTVLMRFPSNAVLALNYGNTNFTSEIMFNEPSLGVMNQPAIPLMRKFNARVVEIIKLFDTP